MEALCSPRTGELTPAELAHCLQALASLLKSPWARVQLVREERVLVELCNVLHRQLLSQDGVAEQIAILEVLSLAVLAAQEDLAVKKKLKMKDLFPANQSVAEEPAECPSWEKEEMTATSKLAIRWRSQSSKFASA